MFKSESNNREELFTEVLYHYNLAKEDMDVRRTDWDKTDELFRSYINESGWPYSSLVFDPRIFTAIFEKTSRLLANKPRGRMAPREGGDALGAKINNELLRFQWDENERVDATPMLAKWAQMDMNSRKYGASFALVKWRYERQVKPGRKDKGEDGKSTVYYDGPDFKPLVNRDVLVNPSYSAIKNWFQHRDYLTLDEMQTVNDAARSKPVYENLDLLRQKIKEAKVQAGDSRGSNYTSRNLSIQGLSDQLGRDEYFQVIEIVTEYRPNRWITFAPKHGVVLRDIPNPYNHGQIPVVMLRYYPVDDDIYGLSEIEPVQSLQKGINALVNQYLDAINMVTYPVIKVRSTGVQMHTLEFGPGKKWLMNDPMTDVVFNNQQPAGISDFGSTYRFMISAMQEGLGETSEGVSNLTPGGANKTATEIQDTSQQRRARDNFNQIFLSEALKKQMGFWHTMNKQFLFEGNEGKQKIIRITGKDAIRYFQQMGLDQMGVTPEVEELLSDPNIAELGINPQQLVQPMMGVQTEDGMLPKFNIEPGGETGSLILEKDDLSGEYDYIPDIESMSLPNDNQLQSLRQQLVVITQNPTTLQLLAQDGYKIKTKEMLEDLFEQGGLKDADKYFEKLQEGGMLNGGQTLGAGGAGTGAVSAPIGVGAGTGVQGSPAALSGGQNMSLMARSA